MTVKPAFKKGRRLCAFCGATASKKGEHFWPAWAKDLLPNSERKVRAKIKNDEVVDFKDQPGAVKTIQIRAVCEECNNTWMSQLEQETKPALEVLFRKSIAVDVAQEWQSVLAQ